jgi:RNA polymerase subunit RPABC4/transcription elongation factor Spt4
MLCEGIVMAINLTNQIVCPVCKGINLSTHSEGMLFKKKVLTCNNCKTVMEQSGKGDNSTFMVRQVGEEYSNADRLFKDKTFTIPELSKHELPVVPDTLLEEYANGNLEGLSIIIGLVKKAIEG